MRLINKLRRLFGSETERFAAPAVTEEAEAPPTRPRPRAAVTTERVSPPPHNGPQHQSRYLSAQEAAELLVPGADGKLPVRIRDGFFEHVPTGKRVPPANRALNSHGLVSFTVRGDAYYDSKAADTRPGQRAQLVREPANKHDSNAVAVYAHDGTGERVKVGYVNKGLARRLAKRMDSGDAVHAWYMRGDPPGEDEEGVAVVLTDEDSILRLLGP